MVARERALSEQWRLHELYGLGARLEGGLGKIEGKILLGSLSFS